MRRRDTTQACICPIHQLQYIPSAHDSSDFGEAMAQQTLGSVVPRDWTNITRWTNLMHARRTPMGAMSQKPNIRDLRELILFQASSSLRFSHLPTRTTQQLIFPHPYYLRLETRNRREL